MNHPEYVRVGAAALMLLAISSTTTEAAPPRLLPFQGRLTDANGASVADGAKVVQFKIYDAPIGGNTVWPGEVQKLTVNGGLVSTLLGSKADLGAVDFNQALYLEITVDANADNQITVADPPLLPRQSILPAVFAVEAESARNSSKLQGFDWSTILAGGSNNPITGKIALAKLEDQTGLVPPGTILPYGGTEPPEGYLLCIGNSFPRSQYPALFKAIGGRFGAADADSFNVPDLRGRFLRGVDGDAGRDRDKNSRSPMASGGLGGNNIGSIQPDAFQGHFHEYAVRLNGFTFANGESGFDNFNAAPTGFSGDRILGPTTDGVNGVPRTSSETRPVNVNINYIIKY